MHVKLRITGIQTPADLAPDLLSMSSHFLNEGLRNQPARGHDSQAKNELGCGHPRDKAANCSVSQPWHRRRRR